MPKVTEHRAGRDSVSATAPTRVLLSMMDGTLLGGCTAYEQGTSYLAMLLMSSYESSFGFQKTLVAHTNTEKKADLQAVEI